MIKFETEYGYVCSRNNKIETRIKKEDKKYYLDLYFADTDGGLSLAIKRIKEYTRIMRNEAFYVHNNENIHAD